MARAYPISTLRRQAQQKAAVHERRAAHFPLRARKTYPSLKAPVRYFQAMNRSAARDRRQLAQPSDEQRILLDRDLDILRLDPGERRNDRQLALALEYIDRRLPVRRRCAREAGPEELTMQLLRPLDHRAGFGPHPASRIGCAHCTCLLNQMNVLGIRSHSSKFGPHARDLPVSARCREAAWRRPRPQGRRSRGLRANESVLPLADLRTRSEHTHASVLFSYHQRARKPEESERNGLAGQYRGARGGGGAGERAQTRQGHAGPGLAGMVRQRGGPARAPGG